MSLTVIMPLLAYHYLIIILYGQIVFGSILMTTAYKISDLIILLVQKQEEYGDLDLVYLDDNFNYRIAVTVDVDENTIPVLVFG